MSGRQAEKFDALSSLQIDGDGWRDARSGWQAPLTAAPEGSWDAYPALNDLLPWTAPGVKANRTWVYAPGVDILDRRWRRLVGEEDLDERRRLFKESRDATLDAEKKPLPGPGTHQFTTPFRREAGRSPTPVRVGYRSFDRQWLVPDSRLLHGPSPPLWQARIPCQVFVVEQHSKPISDGPGIVLSALIPDMDHFNNRGGRVLPLLHPGGRPNLAPGLLDALATLVGGDLFEGSVAALDLLAYLAAVVAHPAYTETFADELTTPGIRVPVTGDPALWEQAVTLGRDVVWAQNYGESCADAALGRPPGDVRFPAGDPRRVLHRRPIGVMPSTLITTTRRRRSDSETAHGDRSGVPCSTTPSAARTSSSPGSTIARPYRAEIRRAHSTTCMSTPGRSSGRPS